MLIPHRKVSHVVTAKRAATVQTGISIARRTDMMKFLGVVAAAVLLGMVSPFMAAVDDGPILQAWFQWLPIQVDLVFLPEGELVMLALAMVVLAAQYLLMFMLAVPMRPLVRRLLKFISAPWRRGVQVH